MKVFAFDLGTQCGFALGDYNGADKPAVISGSNSLKGSRFSGGGMRYVHFRKMLNEIVDAGGLPDQVVYEEVRRHAGTDAAHVYGGLQAVLTAWCEDNKVPYEAVSVGTIKKFATGKGNASKEQMIEAVTSWGYSPDDDNAADALALLHYWLVEHEGAEKPELKQVA